MDAPRIPVRQILAATAAQAGLTVEAMMDERAPHGPAVEARQRAVLLARSLRPDRSWPALGQAFGRNHASLLDAAGAAAVRYARDTCGERAKVQAIAEALGAQVGEMDVPAARRRYLQRTLRAAQRRTERTYESLSQALLDVALCSRDLAELGPSQARRS